MIGRSVCLTVLAFLPLTSIAQVSDPQNRGYVQKPDIKAPPVVVWKYESRKGVGLGSACLADGVVYIGDDPGVLRAFRCDDGKKLWEFNHGERIYSRPVCDGTRVYVSTQKGVEAVDCKTGQSVWKRPLSGCGKIAVWPARAPGDGKIQTVFVGSDDGMMNAFTAKGGRKRWRESMMVDVPGDPAGFDGNRARFKGKASRPSGIATDGKMVFQSVFDQSRVVAMSTVSGDTKWSFPTQGWIGAAPMVDGDRVLISSQDKKLYCVDRNSGEKQWEFVTGSRVSSTATVRRNKVFVPSCDGYMYCLERDTGNELWKYRTDPDEGGRRAIYSLAVVTDDTIYFAVGSGLVYALNTETGKLRWKLRPNPESDLYTSVVTDGTRLFVVSRPSGKNKGTNALIAIGPAPQQ